MPFSTVPNDTEDGRGFLQQRLALFGKCLFFLLMGIGATSVAAIAVAHGDNPWWRLQAPPYHIVVIPMIVAVWRYCRVGNRSLRLLETLDAGVTLLCGVSFSAMLVIAPLEIVPAIPATLGLTHLVVSRAVIVPSHWRRTLAISSLAAGTVALSIVLFGSRALGPGAGRIPPLWELLLCAWCALAVALATVTSHTLYRLRSRVAEARKLGQYTLEQKIGEGGMGVVYRARHAMLRRPTVVKLLPQERAGQANIARFEREVQLTSQLSSPNTVAIYDYGRTPEGIFYYAMEHLDGVDLEQLVAQRGTLPASRAIHLLAQACAALAEAHDAGLVHRDIKPSNLMLCRHGGAVDVVKVLDFGLVKEVGGGGDVKLTQADAMLGTPLYVSPESVKAPESVDARSDLYALGAVGYFLVAGRPVFEGRTVTEVCAQHLYEPPVPPSRWAPELAADLEAVLLRCLAKEKGERPASARALRAALLACADAGAWTEELARAWWEARSPAERPPSIELAQTVGDQRQATTA